MNPPTAATAGQDAALEDYPELLAHRPPLKNAKIVSADQYVRLALSRRRLVRWDIHRARLRGLIDRSTGECFLAARV